MPKLSFRLLRETIDRLVRQSALASVSSSWQPCHRPRPAAVRYHSHHSQHGASSMWLHFRPVKEASGNPKPSMPRGLQGCQSHQRRASAYPCRRVLPEQFKMAGDGVPNVVAASTYSVHDDNSAGWEQILPVVVEHRRGNEAKAGCQLPGESPPTPGVHGSAGRRTRRGAQVASLKFARLGPFLPVSVARGSKAG